MAPRAAPICVFAIHDPAHGPSLQLPSACPHSNEPVSGSHSAVIQGMRTFVVVLIAIVLGGLFLVQKRHEQNAAPAPASTTASAQKPSTPRPVSEHDWAKHSLDKTRSVMSKVAEQRKADGNAGR